MSRDTARLMNGLRGYLPRGDRITGVRTLSAGHSNETYLVEGLDEILRMPPSAEGLLPPYDMARQHAILAAVAAHAPELASRALIDMTLARGATDNVTVIVVRYHRRGGTFAGHAAPAPWS